MFSPNELASTITRGNPDATAVLVFDADGRVAAAADAGEEMVAAAVALLAPLRDMIERSLASLGCGEMNATLISGSKATIALADVDGIRAVAVMGADGAAPGSLLQDARWAAQQLVRGQAA